MAQRTQMRLHAITGSLTAIQTKADSSVAAAPAVIASEHLLDMLGEFAGAIQRIHGGSAFTQQAAGQFSHALTGSAGLKLAGDLDVNAPADIQGAVNLQSTLTVGGAVDINASADIQGALNLQDTLTVAGAVDINAAADIQGAVGMQSTLAVTGAVDMLSTLHVVGVASLDSAITGSAGLKLAGDLDVNSTADFQGAVQFQSTINVDGIATLASAVVEDLTPGRVVYVGAGDALVDSDKMTFADGVLTVSGSTFSKDVSVAQDLSVARDISARSGSFSGDLTVQGDLFINGTTTTINSTTVTVDDKNIELGSTAAPTDAGADGGGITLKGATDHSIIWRDAQDAWEFSEHLVPAGTKDLGLTGDRWENLWLNGNADIDGTIDVQGAANLQSTLAVGGVASFSAAITGSAGLKLAGDLDVNSSADFQGAVNMQAGLTVGGAAAFNAIVDANQGLSASLIKIDGDTATRLYIVDADGSMKDEADLTYSVGKLLVGGAAGLEVTNAAVMKSSLVVTGAVDMLSTFHSVGAATLDSTLFVDGAVTLSGSVDLVDAGLQAITKQGGDLRINVAAGELLLSDKWNDASNWSADSITLSDSAAEWDNFKAAFGGEVSLLNAIVAANGGTAGGKFKKVIASAVNAGTAVAGNTIAKMAGAGDFAAGYAGLTAGTEKNKVDIYVNGQLMLEGASDDYEISAGDITFKFDLFVDDVILAIVR